MSIRLAPSFAQVLQRTDRPLIGAWICSGSPIAAEIVAGSGLDWTLIDGEHSPIGLESIVALLQAIAPYPITPVVRVPSADPVGIKQVLDAGAQNLIVPMVNSAKDAAAAVAATRYPPQGIRGVGSALSRSGQWGRTPDYLQRAHEIISLSVQIETDAAVQSASAIAKTDGVDAVFIGPSDLAASMGLLGQQEHPEVIAAVEHTIAEVRAAGKPVGVNAFAPATARRYLDAGANFALVAADVSILARETERLAAEWVPNAADAEHATY